MWEVVEVKEMFSGIEGVKSLHCMVVGYRLDDSAPLSECRGTKMAGNASLERFAPANKNKYSYPAIA